MAKPFLILQTGTVPSFLSPEIPDFYRMVLEGADYAGLKPQVLLMDANRPPAPAETYAGVIVAGCPPEDDRPALWSDDWLKKAIKGGTRILGICHGHQLMARAMGGRTGVHPEGPGMGTHTVFVLSAARRRSLLSGLPEFFNAQMAHSQTVLTAPPGAAVLGLSSHDKHQILAYGDKALSVQFHPEFNRKVMEEYVNHSRDHEKISLGLPVKETPVAAGLLQSFVRACARA